MLTPPQIFKNRYSAGALHRPFKNDYLAYLNICRKISQASMVKMVEEALPLIVDMLFVLQRLSFFPTNPSLPVSLHDCASESSSSVQIFQEEQLSIVLYSVVEIFDDVITLTRVVGKNYEMTLPHIENFCSD
jgi:hypothetical protein